MADYTLPGREFFRRSIFEQRGNPYHDPSNGRFCSGGGSGLTNSANGGKIDLKKRKVGFNNASNGKPYVPYDSKGNPYTSPEYYLPPAEYKKVTSDINSSYDTMHKGKDKSTIRNVIKKGKNKYEYTTYEFEIHGYDEYNIFNKYKF